MDNKTSVKEEEMQFIIGKCANITKNKGIDFSPTLLS